MKYTPPPFICPFVDTADMEMVVMVVTTLHMVITSRPCTGRTQCLRSCITDNQLVKCCCSVFVHI